MAKNVVAVKSKGFSIAQEYISRACKDAAYLGVALAQEGALLIHHEPKKPTVEGVNSILEKFKDTTVVFCFGENSKTLLEEDRLPFLVTLDKAKGDEVAVFLTGDFQGYEVKGSSHTSEYHCFQDFLEKKLPKIYRGAGSDITEFLKELNDPITQQDLSNSWTNRGFISILASNGEVMTIFNKGNVFVRTYEFGTVSDGLGYEEKAAAAPKPEEKKLSMLEKMMLKKEGKPIPSEATASVPAVPAPKQDTSSAAISAAISDDQFEEVSLPAEAKDWTNKKKIQWWVSEVGYKPNGYKDMKLKVKRTKGTKKGILADLADANGDLPAIVHDAATASTEERVVPAASMKVDPKTLPEKKEAPENAKNISPQHVLVDNLPILSPKQKLNLRKEFLADAEIVKILGDDMQTLAIDPKRLKELEDNYQPFWDGLGKDTNPNLTFEGHVKLGTLDLKALAILAFNNQNDRIRAELRLASVLKANPSLKLAM
jgi:hypothetical protein